MQRSTVLCLSTVPQSITCVVVVYKAWRSYSEDFVTFSYGSVNGKGRGEDER